MDECSGCFVSSSFLKLLLNFTLTEKMNPIIYKLNFTNMEQTFSFGQTSIFACCYRCFLPFLGHHLNASSPRLSPPESLTGGVCCLDAETEHLTRLDCYFPAGQQVCFQQDDTLSDVSTAPVRPKKSWTDRLNITKRPPSRFNVEDSERETREIISPINFNFISFL